MNSKIDIEWLYTDVISTECNTQLLKIRQWLGIKGIKHKFEYGGYLGNHPTTIVMSREDAILFKLAFVFDEFSKIPR